MAGIYHVERRHNRTAQHVYSRAKRVFVRSLDPHDNRFVWSRLHREVRIKRWTGPLDRVLASAAEPDSFDPEPSTRLRAGELRWNWRHWWDRGHRRNGRHRRHWRNGLT